MTDGGAVAFCVVCGKRLPYIVDGEDYIPIALKCPDCDEAYKETIEWVDICNDMEEELKVLRELQKEDDEKRERVS